LAFGTYAFAVTLSDGLGTGGRDYGGVKIVVHTEVAF